MTKEIREAFTCKKNDGADVNTDMDMGINVNMSVGIDRDMDMDIDIDRDAIVRSVSISLTPEEKQLFQTLENAAIAYETQTLPPLPEDDDNDHDNDNDKTNNHSPDRIPIPDPDPSKKVAIRVAGGWVRDKLLNQSSHDIDIALDSLSGLQFASIVQRYLLHQQQQQKEQQLKEQQQKEHGVKDGKDDEDESNAKSKGKAKCKGKAQKKPKIAVIAANPNQSKHLETATMKIHSIDVDFVHLRGGEIYAANSRIPTTKENATPLDDALRRDFTVNSLFYNLRGNGSGHGQQYIEDYTGRGIPDLLQHKTLVTPIDASLTFHDDPLRVLRAVRFGVRYNLKLSDEIVAAARSAVVHDSLHRKVSRERVGKELEGMLSGKNARPDVALGLIADLKLGGCVFCFPSPAGSGSGSGSNSCERVVGCISMEGKDGVEYNNDYLIDIDNDYDNNDNINDNGASGNEVQTAAAAAAAGHAREMGWEEAASTLNHASPLLRHLGNHEMATTSTTSTKLDKRLLYLSTFLYPFRKLSYIDKKKKVFPLIVYMMKESVKFPNRDVNSMKIIMENVDEMRSIFNEYKSSLLLSSPPMSESESTNEEMSTSTANENSTISESLSFCRLRIGLVLRQLKDLWSTALVVAAIAEIRSITLENTQMDEDDDDNDNDDGNHSHGNGTCTDGKSDAEATARHIADVAMKFYDNIQKSNLDFCWKLRPHLDGKAIVSSLDLPRGPAVGTYIEEQVRWMLLNPNGSRVECEEHLKSLRKRELERSGGGVGENSTSTNEDKITTSGESTCTQQDDNAMKRCKKKAHVEK